MNQPSKLSQPLISIIGLGYVGLPLAQAFSKNFKVIGFDSNVKKKRCGRIYQRQGDKIESKGGS